MALTVAGEMGCLLATAALGMPPYPDTFVAADGACACLHAGPSYFCKSAQGSSNAHHIERKSDHSG
jgi:hypothetical protein